MQSGARVSFLPRGALGWRKGSDNARGVLKGARARHWGREARAFLSLCSWLVWYVVVSACSAASKCEEQRERQG